MSFRDLFFRTVRTLTGSASHPTAPDVTIREASVGDLVSVPGGRTGYSDLDLTIDRKYRYTAGHREWFEFSATTAGKRVFLEVEEKDQLTVFLYADGQSFTLDELQLSEEDLALMDDRQNPADNFPFASRTWIFRQSRNMSRFDDQRGTAEGFFGWVFQPKFSEERLTIRKFEGEGVIAIIGTKVAPEGILVLRPASA